MHLLKLRPVFVCLLIIFISFSSLFAKKHSATEKAGDIIQITIPVTSLLIAFGKDDTEGMKQLFYSVAASTAATWALKLAIHKKRPRGGKYAFPSAHTSLAFTGSTFLGMRYGYTYGIPSTAAASYVGYSRVHAKRHDWTDVIGGAIIGGLSGYFFTTRHESIQKTEKSQADGTQISSVVDISTEKK